VASEDIQNTADEAYTLLVEQMAAAGEAAALNLGSLIDNLIASGMTPEQAEAFLLADLSNKGPIFGDFLKGIEKQFDSGIKFVQDRVDFASFDSQAKALGYGRAEEMVMQWQAIVGDGRTCPDCLDRDTMPPMSREEWAAIGLPAQGGTICGPFCRCRLIPVPKGMDLETFNKTRGGPIRKARLKRLDIKES
jgi:hypothetical protein